MPPSNRRFAMMPNLAPPSNLTVYRILEDCKHSQAIVAGDNYDGNIYHQIAGERLNAQWVMRFAETVNGIDYYYLQDRKHDKFLVAGDNYDGRVYHQDHAGRLNAQWATMWGPAGDSVLIIDRKHGKCLVAGDNDDNNVYHQDPNGRTNAYWKIWGVYGFGA